MEGELHEKSHLNQILLDNIPCVALLLRPSTREIVASNRAAVKIGAVPGTTCFAAWAQRDNPCPWCLAPELWKTGQAQHLEVKSQGLIWDAHWAPAGPDLYLHYAFDITDRKKMEDAWRESDDTLRALLNAIPESILLIDSDRVIVTANETLAKRLGKDLAELVGSKICEVLPSEVAKGRAAYADEVMRTGKAVRFEDRQGGRFLDNLIYPIINGAGKVAKLAVLSLDITERKRAEEALSQERDFVATLLQTLGALVIVLDREGRVVRFNRACEQASGYTFQEVKGKPVFDLLLLPEEAREAKKVFQNLTFGEFPCVYENHWVTRDGEQRLFSWSNTALTDDQGRVLYIIGTGIDITERKQAEEALRESEVRLRTLYETVQAGVILQSANGEILQANQTACDIFCMSVHEVTGRTSLDTEWNVVLEDGSPVPGEEHPSMVTLRTGRPIRNAVRGLFAHDPEKMRWLIINTEPIMDSQTGAVREATITFHDITDIKRTEEELRRSEARLSQAEEIAHLGHWDLDIGTHRLTWSKEVYRLFGQDPATFMPTLEAFLAAIHPEDRGRVRRARDAALQEGTNFCLDYRIILPDGSWRSLQERVQISQDEAGNPVQIFGTVQDITEPKRAEEFIKESLRLRQQILDTIPSPIFYKGIDGRYLGVNQAFLRFFGKTMDQVVGKGVHEVFAKEIADRYLQMDQELYQHPGIQVYEFHSYDADGQRREMSLHKATFVDKDGSIAGIAGIMIDITEAKKAAEERLRFSKLESLSTLAGGIAHDFNNILMIILGNIGLAGLDEKVGPQGQESLAQAEAACLRAQSLSQQLLTFAKGGLPIIKTISLDRVLKESTNLALSGSMTRFEFSLPDGLWAVKADEGQMAQVITNLVINADQAMPGGGVIKIGAENIWVGEGSDLPLAPGKYVKLTFADQGIGIPAKYLDKIFDPYFSTKQKGSGLGLATAFSIIQNHAGYIKAESTVSEGTTFHLYLPAAETGPLAEEQEKPQWIKGQGRILVMDDEEMVREVLGRMLEHLGYEVDVASDGSEAIEKFVQAKEAGQPFAMVILDLTIPGGMGGKETIQKLLEIDPRIKALVSSGYSEDQVMGDYAQYGFCEVITKPYRVVELSKILQKIMLPTPNRPERGKQP